MILVSLRAQELGLFGRTGGKSGHPVPAGFASPHYPSVLIFQGLRGLSSSPRNGEHFGNTLRCLHPSCPAEPPVGEGMERSPCAHGKHRQVQGATTLQNSLPEAGTAPRECLEPPGGFRLDFGKVFSPSEGAPRGMGTVPRAPGGFGQHCQGFRVGFWEEWAWINDPVCPFQPSISWLCDSVT